MRCATMRIVGLTVGLAVVAAPVWAGEVCPGIVGGASVLAARDAAHRLAFLRARLALDARRARQWSWGFGGGYAAITSLSAAAAPLQPDRGAKADVLAGGASALVGLGLIVLAPLPVMRDHDALEAHVAGAGPEVPICRLVTLAERMLVRGARAERFGKGWFTHTGNALLGVAALLVLGLGFGRWQAGAINGGSSIAVGELMIALQPAGLVRDLAAYRAGDLGPRRPWWRRRR